MEDQRNVIIPAGKKSEALLLSVDLEWKCPTCGGPRGEQIHKTSNFDKPDVYFDIWSNPCGHLETYADNRREALNNGLN